MPITASVMISGRNYVDGVREQLQAVAQHAERADLVHDRHHQHRAGRGGLHGGVGQPAVERPQRRLDREREHEAAEQQRSSPPGSPRTRPLDTAATIARKSNVPAAKASLCAVTTYRPITAASMIRPPNRLYSRNFTAALATRFVAAESADQEVHRDQHGLEEHVEQQHVQRRPARSAPCPRRPASARSRCAPTGLPSRSGRWRRSSPRRSAAAPARR